MELRILSNLPPWYFSMNWPMSCCEVSPAFANASRSLALNVILKPTVCCQMLIRLSMVFCSPTGTSPQLFQFATLFFGLFACRRGRISRPLRRRPQLLTANIGDARDDVNLICQAAVPQKVASRYFRRVPRLQGV